MRRITRAAWLAMAGALLASLLSVVAFVRVGSQPRMATSLAGANQPPLLSVVLPDGVVVITPEGGYRLRGDLRVEPLKWNYYGRIVAVRSAAWSGGDLGLIVSIERDGASGLEVLTLHDGELRVERNHPYQGQLVGIFPAKNGFDLYEHLGTNLVHYQPGTLEMLQLLHGAPSDAVEGMVAMKGERFMLIGERGAHWLLDLKGRLHPLPEGAYAVWSPSLLRPPLNGPSRIPFLDESGNTQAFAPAGAPVLRLEKDGTLAPLMVTRSSDEPGVIVTLFRDRRVEAKHAARRVWVSSDGRPAWRAVATSTLPCDFHAIPFGQNWLLVGDHGGEAIALDARLQRVDRGEPMFVALTSQPREVWWTLLTLLGLFAAALPLMVARTLRSLRHLESGEGLFSGVLKLPPGAVAAAGRDGRVNLAGNCQLRCGARTYDLTSGPLRFDSQAGTPLCDGDPVYLVGRVESDRAGGPFRAAQRERLGPDLDRYFIGRGNGDDFAQQWSARANGRLLAFALAHLTLAFAVLGFLGLRPFI